jgi:hypothetical protein
MQARIVQTARGVQWLAEGWRLFSAAPLGWLALAFIYTVIMMVMSALPLIGAAAFLVLYPAFTVGWMAAARAASKTSRVDVGLLFDGFRHGLRAQLILGALYLACSIVVFAGMALADDERVLQKVVGGAATGEVDIGDLAGPLAVMAVLYTPMLMIFWFAPPLAAWHGVGAVKSLFFSFVACLLNWRALLLYGAAILGVIAGLASFLLFAFALASGEASKAVPPSAALFALILFFPTLFASIYASYRDVFGAEPAGP